MGDLTTIPVLRQCVAPPASKSDNDNPLMYHFETMVPSGRLFAKRWREPWARAGEHLFHSATRTSAARPPPSLVAGADLPVQVIASAAAGFFVASM
jgi:hypothetical protein